MTIREGQVQYNLYLPQQVRDQMKAATEVNWPWVLRNAIAAKLSELQGDNHESQRLSQEQLPRSD